MTPKCFSPSYVYKSELLEEETWILRSRSAYRGGPAISWIYLQCKEVPGATWLLCLTSKICNFDQFWYVILPFPPEVTTKMKKNPPEGPVSWGWAALQVFFHDHLWEASLLSYATYSKPVLDGCFFSIKPFFLPCYWQIAGTAIYVPAWPSSPHIHAMQIRSSIRETMFPCYSSAGI